MASRAIKPTDRRRFLLIQDIGCIACIMLGVPHEPCDIHHVTDCGRRMKNEHQCTIGLCPYHHRGMPRNGQTLATMEYLLGPSLHHDKKGFIARFGTELQLLEAQNSLLRDIS